MSEDVTVVGITELDSGLVSHGLRTHSISFEPKGDTELAELWYDCIETYLVVSKRPTIMQMDSIVELKCGIDAIIGRKAEHYSMHEILARFLPDELLNRMKQATLEYHARKVSLL